MSSRTHSLANVVEYVWLFTINCVQEGRYGNKRETVFRESYTGIHIQNFAFDYFGSATAYSVGDDSGDY